MVCNPARLEYVVRMNQRIRHLFNEAQRLTEREREELAELLLATVEADQGIEAAWVAEAEDRIAAHERGETTARPAADVLRKHLDK